MTRGLSQTNQSTTFDFHGYMINYYNNHIIGSSCDDARLLGHKEIRYDIINLP